MAKADTMTVQADRMLSSVTISVRFGVAHRVRLWLAARLFALAGLVGGMGTLIWAEGDYPLEFTNGFPRALSIMEGFKGYRRDAEAYGSRLIVKLDGVEQTRAVAYDIDAGRISRYPDDGGILLEHRKGVVTVELRP